MEFHIDNMNCGGCARSVTKTIQSVDPQAAVVVDLDAKTVSVTSAREASAFAGALAEDGFPARVAGA